jgi:hypothetical protein
MEDKNHKILCSSCSDNCQKIVDHLSKVEPPSQVCPSSDIFIVVKYKKRAKLENSKGKSKILIHCVMIVQLVIQLFICLLIIYSEKCF